MRTLLFLGFVLGSVLGAALLVAGCNDDLQTFPHDGAESSDAPMAVDLAEAHPGQDLSQKDDLAVVVPRDGGGGDLSMVVATDGGGGGSGGDMAGCPAYQSLCGGACIPTANDPHNCGGCNVVCAANTTCSSGQCVAGCLPGLMNCNQSCVDLGSDNNNCGACGMQCPNGMGCAGGTCQPAANLGPAPAMCANGGPPIVIDVNGTNVCGGGLAQVTFTWALCSCGDVTVSSNLLTDAFDSTKGPYVPGGIGGGVGMNGTLFVSSPTDVWGTLWTSDVMGIKTSAPATVHYETHAGGPLMVQGFSVAKDAYVNGDINGSPMSVGGNLYQPAGDTITGNVTYGALIHQAVAVPPPCNCSGPGLVPVGAIVAARQLDNDNASIGLDPMIAAQNGGPRRIDLPCGQYYLDSINSGQALTLYAHGHTALYIGGDVVSGAPLTITLDPTATLDLFIAGTIQSSAPLVIGSPNYPALSRTYVGSASKLQLSAGTSIGGNFWAGNAPLFWSAPVVIYGAVFAGDFTASSMASIHYDTAVLSAGSECPPPTNPKVDMGAPRSDMGTPPGGCMTCRDCGNQACINGVCGNCTDSSQCCAPLVCFQGTCVPGVP